MSASLSEKSNTLAFSTILPGLVDLGIVMNPRCRDQRISTWAQLLLYLRCECFGNER